MVGIALLWWLVATCQAVARSLDLQIDDLLHLMVDALAHEQTKTRSYIVKTTVCWQYCKLHSMVGGLKPPLPSTMERLMTSVLAVLQVALDGRRLETSFAFNDGTLDDL